MTWSALSARIDRMPTVLAGPIVRTVTRTSVTVWLALKEAATVTLAIYDNDSVVTQAIGTTTVPASKIGPNLYIVALTANILPVQLQLGKTYFYRLSFATKKGTLDLVQATGAANMAAFAYAPYNLPSFLLPPSNIEQVRFALGSCRKTHAASPDALAMLDDVLSAGIANTPAARPQILMLGGDQIYADEVADTLLMMLTDAGATLLGPEELPVSSTKVLSPGALPPGTRTKVIKDAGFTSDDTRSHLMGLGEYLAMYLFAWSDVLWIDPATGLPVLPAVEDVFDLYGFNDDLDAARKLKLEMIQQRSWVAVTYSTLPRVRRALANIATYMILDDHEITDDFNMQRRFCDKVYGSSLGMRVVQNGLLAYALCQHWGNCPEQFSGSASGARLLSLFSAATDYTVLARNVDLQKIVGLHAPAQLAARTPYAVYHDADSLSYNYTIEGEAFQLIVTDTRTWRSFPRGGPLSPPDLIQEGQFATQIPLTPPLGNRLLMVLVTTNMPPCPSIRQAGRDLPSLPGHSYDFEDFFDGWQIEQIDFARMIAAIAKKVATAGAMSPFAGRVVLLSGDVHSSQATRLGYWATQQVGDPAGAPTPAQVVFAQIVASALHNQNNATLGEHQDGYGFLPSFTARMGAQPVQLTEGFVGWNPVTLARGTKLGTRTTMFPMTPLIVSAGDTTVAVDNSVKLDVPFDPDRPNQTTRGEQMGTIWIKTPIRLTATPHYRYRLDYLNRAASGMSVSTPAHGTTPLANQAAASTTYLSWYLPGAVQQVGKSNLGDLTFARASGHPDLVAKFLVRWGEAGSDLWVRFDVSVDPNDPAYPPLSDPT